MSCVFAFLLYRAPLAASSAICRMSLNCLIPFVAIRFVVVSVEYCAATIGYTQGRPSQRITEVVPPTQGVFKYPDCFLISAAIDLSLFPEGALWVEHLIAGEREGIHPVVAVRNYPYDLTLIKCDMTRTTQPYTPGDANWERH